MTDEELLELAAKAAGMEDGSWWDGWSDEGRGTGEYWNPLTNDGDALRLAVKLELSVQSFGGWDYEDRAFAMVYNGKTKQFTEELHNNDPYAATRRAIVRAASEIGKEMK